MTRHAAVIAAFAKPSLTDPVFRNLHPGCYHHGGPWRRVAAERAQKAASLAALREYEP